MHLRRETDVRPVPSWSTPSVTSAATTRRRIAHMAFSPTIARPSSIPQPELGAAVPLFPPMTSEPSGIAGGGPRVRRATSKRANLLNTPSVVSARDACRFQFVLVNTVVSVDVVRDIYRPFIPSVCRPRPEHRPSRSAPVTPWAKAPQVVGNPYLARRWVRPLSENNSRR